MRTGVESGSARRGGLLNGVMLLTASTLICKVIGLLFKIPIIGIVGIDGMAYFSAAYNVYMLLNSVAAAGLPVALSILVAKSVAQGRRANADKTFWVAMVMFASLGIVGTAALYFGAEVYSEAIGIKEAAASVKAIAPTLVFICFSGGIRGYFQGFKIMTPTAVSQLLESVGKLVLGVSFAYFALNGNNSSSATAAAAVSGLSAGVLVSLVYLIIRLIFFNSRESSTVNNKLAEPTDKVGHITKSLLYIAFPITLSSCITSLTGIADTALITNRLIVGGLSRDAAVTLYSSYTNLAIPLFNLPPALIAPIAVSLVPALTSSVTQGNSTASANLFDSSVRLCNMLAIPAAAGMAVFAKPILLLIFPAEREACLFAAPLLTILSVAIVFSCLITVLNAVLQAHMKPILPIISMAIGAVVKIITEYALVATDLGVMGAPISTIACTSAILLCNLIFVTVYTPHRIEFKSVFKTLISSIISVSLAAVMYRVLLGLEINNTVVLILSILLAVCVYLIMVLLLGLIRRSDVVNLPFGNRLANLFGKMKLIKE